LTATGWRGRLGDETTIKEAKTVKKPEIKKVRALEDPQRSRFPGKKDIGNAVLKVVGKCVIAGERLRRRKS